LWASSLREVKKRIRPLFAQERAALNAGLFVDGRLVGPMLDGSHHGEGEHDERARLVRPCEVADLLQLGAARQTAFMCARAQSAKFVNPLGTRALAAAMYRSCSGPKYVCSAKYWNISRISWAPG